MEDTISIIQDPEMHQDAEDQRINSFGTQICTHLKVQAKFMVIVELLKIVTVLEELSDAINVLSFELNTHLCC